MRPVRDASVVFLFSLVVLLMELNNSPVPSPLWDSCPEQDERDRSMKLSKDGVVILL